MSDEHQRPVYSVGGLILAAKAQLDAEHPAPSRAKALAQTKLDEALLWLREVEDGRSSVVVRYATQSDEKEG